MGKRIFIVMAVFLGVLLISSCGAKHEIIQEIKETKAPNQTNVIKAEIDIPEEQPGPQIICGDGVCEDSENTCTCAEDCGSCENQTAGFCFESFCNADNQCVFNKKSSCCGDGVCDANETCSSCISDCCKLENIAGPKDLSEFPRLIEGTSTIVGNNAPASDVVSASEVVEPLLSEGFSFGQSLLTSDISSINEHTYVIVGGPCNNKFAAELLSKELMLNNNDCNNVFAEHEGLIKVYATSSNHISLLVSGNTAQDVRMAARVLKNYEEHNLQGVAVKVTGSLNNPTITRIE